MIIPKLPPKAKADVVGARANNQPVFHRVPMSRANQEYDCQNCMDLATVIVSTATSGPYKFPPRNARMLYFDGDGHIAPGWYIVETQEYRCPECQIGTHLPPIVNEEEDDQEKQQEIPF